MFINYVLKVGLELFLQYNLRVSTTKHLLHAINKLKQENKVPMQMKSQSYIKRLNFFTINNITLKLRDYTMIAQSLLNLKKTVKMTA